MRVFPAILFVALAAGCSSSTCPAWDAHGSGLCNLILGFAWDGQSCVAVSGCDCAGADCDLLRRDDDAAACLATMCEPRGDAGR